jgi:hypothetical protein
MNEYAVIRLTQELQITKRYKLKESILRNAERSLRNHVAEIASLEQAIKLLEAK